MLIILKSCFNLLNLKPVACSCKRLCNRVLDTFMLVEHCSGWRIPSQSKLHFLTMWGTKKRVRYFQVTLLECKMRLNKNMDWILELDIEIKS